MKPKILKDLAKSTRYQILYNRAKEIGSLSLFRNKRDLTKIQIYFLHLLEMYNTLYTDLLTKEPNITEEILDDELRTEAYLLWKSEKKNKKEVDKEDNSRFSILPKIKFRNKRK